MEFKIGDKVVINLQEFGQFVGNIANEWEERTGVKGFDIVDANDNYCLAELPGTDLRLAELDDKTVDVPKIKLGDLVCFVPDETGGRDRFLSLGASAPVCKGVVYDIQHRLTGSSTFYITAIYNGEKFTIEGWEKVWPSGLNLDQRAVLRRNGSWVG